MREDQDHLEELEVFNESLSTNLLFSTTSSWGTQFFHFFHFFLGPRERFQSVNNASVDICKDHWEMGSVLSAAYCCFDGSFCRYCAAETPAASPRRAVEIKLSVFLGKPWCQAGAERSNYKSGIPWCLCDPAKDGWASDSPCWGSPNIFSIPETETAFVSNSWALYRRYFLFWVRNVSEVNYLLKKNQCIFQHLLEISDNHKEG